MKLSVADAMRQMMADDKPSVTAIQAIANPVLPDTATPSTMSAMGDNPQHQSSTASDSSPLLKLAAELRNTIYELAFTPDHDDDSIGVELVEATGPSKALLLTCREIYDEARGIHKQAH